MTTLTEQARNGARKGGRVYHLSRALRRGGHLRLDVVNAGTRHDAFVFRVHRKNPDETQVEREARAKEAYDAIMEGRESMEFALLGQEARNLSQGILEQPTGGAD